MICRTPAEIAEAGRQAGAALPPLTREQMTRIQLAIALARGRAEAGSGSLVSAPAPVADRGPDGAVHGA